MNSKPDFSINSLGNTHTVRIYSDLRDAYGGYVYDISFVEEFLQTYSSTISTQIYLYPLIKYQNGKPINGYVIEMNPIDNALDVAVTLASELSQKMNVKTMVIEVNGTSYSLTNNRLK